MVCAAKGPLALDAYAVLMHNNFSPGGEQPEQRKLAHES